MKSFAIFILMFLVSELAFADTTNTAICRTITRSDGSVVNVSIQLTNAMAGLAGDNITWDQANTEFDVPAGGNTFPQGWIKGMYCEYSSATSVTIKAGEAFVEGTYYTLTNDITLIVSNWPSTLQNWVHVYIDKSESTTYAPSFKTTTNVSNWVWDDEYFGYYNGADRYVWSLPVFLTSTNTIQTFDTPGDGQTIFPYKNSSPSTTYGMFLQIASNFDPDGSWDATTIDTESITPFSTTAIFVLADGYDAASQSQAQIRSVANYQSPGGRGYGYANVENSGWLIVIPQGERSVEIIGQNNDDPALNGFWGGVRIRR